MATLTQPQEHWRDRAIKTSEVISDLWQVALAYTGRGAEIILFICMVFSIVEMVPVIHLWEWLTNGTLIVQMITLDVAGFGLNSLAKAVRRAGDEQIARKAERMGNTLIAIMIISVISVAVKNLFSSSVPGLDQWIGYLDDALILVRIGATVFFGHIIHELREAQQFAQTEEDTRVADLQSQLHELQSTKQEEITRLQQHLELSLQFSSRLQAKIETLEGHIQELQQAKNATEDGQKTGKNQAEEEDYEQAENGQNDRQNITVLRPKKEANPQAKNRQTSGSTKASRAARAIRQNPEITPIELAKKADIDVSYARKILAETRGKSVANG